MSDIATQIIDELTGGLFESNPVRIWYDPRQKYTGIIDDVEEALESNGVNVERYDGSFFELKRTLWERDPDVEERWLFYIPESQSEADWFLDVHKMGSVYRPRVDVSDDPAASYLVERTEEIPSEFSGWATDPDALKKAFFTVLFRENHFTPRDFVVQYLSRPDYYREIIERYEQEKTWGNILESEYGISPTFDSAEIAKQILFGEVESTSPTNRYTELAADDPERAADLCTYWQRHRTKDFLEYANEIESEYDIASAVVDSESLEWESEAFLGIEHGLLHICLDRFEQIPIGDIPDEVPELREAVKRRQDGFWYEDGRANFWDVLAHGLHVIDRTTDARDVLSGEPFSPSELAERYTSEWWEIDREYRRYVQAKADLVHSYEGLTEAGQGFTHYYTAFLKDLNRMLADGFDTSLSIATPQSSFWERYGGAESGTAIIICDALRYELARELTESLEDLDATIETDTLSASLPSITEIGMAAHLPGRLGLDYTSELEVTVDGESIKQKDDRRSIFQDEGFLVEDLNELLSVPAEELREDGTAPRIVYSGYIDRLGENIDSDDQALAQASAHSANVERAVRKLRAAGYRRFVITADHGFLYTERLPEELKVDSPKNAEMVKRRFAVSRDKEHDDLSLVSVSGEELAELGIEAGDITLLFPRSVACFRARGGNVRYFHGGISMQELAVPCVTISAESQLDEGSQFSISVDFPTTVTNNIVTVSLEPEGQMSIAGSRTVILRATADDREVCDPKEVDITHGKETTSLRLKTGELEEASSVMFEAIDGDTREVLVTQRAKLDMVIRDDGFDI